MAPNSLSMDKDSSIIEEASLTRRRSSTISLRDQAPKVSKFGVGGVLFHSFTHTLLFLLPSLCDQIEGLLKKRKGKEVASSSEGARFKTPYHEAHYNSKLSARKILPEIIIQVDKSILDPCAFQIEKRKWEKFTNPIQAVGQNMVKEFYANAWEPEKEKRKPYTYKTMVRGKEISFAPKDIKRVLKLRKNPLPDAASYEERVANKDYRLDHVQEDLCIEGGEGVRHKDGRPHYLRRADLEPMTKGWYDFVCRSIMPTTNCSELIVERAVLIHSIIIGENINVEEIIAKQFYKETRARNPRQEAPPQQPPPQVQPKHQQEFPSNFYTHFDASMSQIYRSLDNQQEESRKSFEAINQRIDRMDDQLSFLCNSNQMVNETMYFPYQNTARQFREMEAQGIPVTIANLAIHRHREEEMNQERMRHNQTVQEEAAERAREENKGKAREIVPDSKEGSDELVSGESEEW
ncbi:hypothetical protein PIB30_040621 [Stylosanthes scabra]|uniref:Putative plant transposon protein domain-containing protein n=1 Tax=Stylosanthes scabra TaxID=79078 RepID=A0ABU6TGU1_9FABA|nr:hypothetical protein [Stylosanthes scabra]